MSARLSQTVIVYAWRTDLATGLTYKGYAMVVVKGTTQQVPDIKLARQ